MKKWIGVSFFVACMMMQSFSADASSGIFRGERITLFAHNGSFMQTSHFADYISSQSTFTACLTGVMPQDTNIIIVLVSSAYGVPNQAGWYWDADGPVYQWNVAQHYEVWWSSSTGRWNTDWIQDNDIDHWNYQDNSWFAALTYRYNGVYEHEWIKLAKYCPPVV